jgi:parallel beta-helix repeat protein
VHVDGRVKIADNVVSGAWGNGIAVAGAAQAEVDNNAVSDTGLDGIFFAEVQRAVVRGNRVAGAGLLGGPRPSLAAINAHRTNAAVVEKNIVDGSAYHGIRFSGDAMVRGNYVVRSCRLLSDCAAIYTWRRGPDDRRPHAEVSGNLVVDVQGDSSVKLGVNDWFTGIYLDDFSNDVSVTGNVVVGANQGIYAHNAYAVDIHGNIVRALQKNLIDAADPKRVPRVLETPNKLVGNDERLGRFTVAFRARDGTPKEFALADGLEMLILPANAPPLVAGKAQPRCATMPALQGSSVVGAPMALSAVFDCN